MAKKVEGKSTELQSAREIVAAADKAEKKASDGSVDVCNCNAHGGAHRHLDRGIIPEEVIQEESRG